MLFVASMFGYAMIRSRAAAWPPPGVPRLPNTLWISTLIIVASSVTIQTALGAARRGRQPALRLALAATSALGLAFLVSQGLNWFSLVAARLTVRTNLYGFTFFTLTGLHALHVIGGLIPLGTITARAFAGRYDATRHAGIEYTAIYWHFLDVVWLVMFAVLVVFA
jgi:cytochrome c oxidase subunit 3